MKTLILALLFVSALISTSSHASVRVFNSTGTQLGIFSDLKLGNGLAVNQVSGKAQVSVTGGDGTQAVAGILHSQSSISGDLAVTQCGASITSDGIKGSTNGPIDLFNLPAISTATLGCRFTFVTGVDGLSNGGSIPNEIRVVPKTADKILLLTSAAGHRISNDVLGDSVTLEATQPGWAPVGKEQGTWNDIN